MIKLISLITCNFFVVAWTSPLVSYKETRPKDSIESDPSFYRLPTTTVPINYTLNLLIDPNEDRFSGKTTIRIKCISDTNQIVLHANALNITKTISGDDRYFYTITLNSTLSKDQMYDLAFEYNAPFGPRLNGLYKSSYRTSNGTMRNSAVTQFEPTYARQAFPCYDEPALKAVFSIHIYAPKGYHCLANMDEIPSNLPPMKGYDATSFRSSPPMSTYLVALVVSDYKYKSNTKDGEVIYPKEYRVYARPTAYDALDYALDFGQRSFKCMQEFIGVDYRLPKIDNVAVSNFNSGAMENWGLITYREEFLLVFKGITSSSEKISISSTITHENSHFWFGDEVSPLWWDYLWLNEGFASFFGHYITDKVYNGEFRLMEKFTVNSMHMIMIQDAKPDSKSMSSPVGSPGEIQAKFSGISYMKGACVIRMIQHVLGESFFRLSLSAYIKNMQLRASEPQILFNEMQKVVEKANILPEKTTIGDIFGSWSDQPGFPIINVTKKSTGLRISQQRFFDDPSITSDQKWWIPLTWASDKNPNFDNTTTQAWMSSNTSEIIIPIESPKWIIFNKQQCGYYRVMYDTEMWNDLIKVLNSDEHRTIHPQNKAQLINDAVLFYKTGRLDLLTTFNLLQYLSMETDVIPWMAVLNSIFFFNNQMAGSKYYNLYQTFVSSISKAAYDSVGMVENDEDNYVTIKKRTTVSDIACKCGMKLCMDDAKSILEKSLQPNSEPLDMDLKKIIYCYGLSQGSESLWERTFEKYEATSTESEKLLIINGLGCSQSDSIIDSYLKMAISNKSRIISEHRLKAINSVINSGSYGIGKLLNFADENFDQLRINLPGSILEIINWLSDAISTDEHIELFLKLSSRDLTPIERNAMEDALSNIFKWKSWRNVHIGEIEDWLKDNMNVYKF